MGHPFGIPSPFGLPSPFGKEGVDNYTVGGLSALMAADFRGDLNNGTPYFRKNGATCTFGDLFSTRLDRTNPATQFDSNGDLVWSAHNLQVNSEEFDDALWTKSSGGTGSDPVVTANAGLAPNGEMTADRVQFDRGAGTTLSDFSILSDGFTITSGAQYTGGFWVKSNTGADQDVMVDVDVGANSGTVITVTDEWQLITETAVASVSPVGVLRIGTQGSGSYGGDQTLDILVWGARAYRSDLGGMAPVPTSERGLSSDSTYLPTTTSARCLPRLEAYTYVGGTLAFHGLQTEEGATNLDPNSDDLSAWTTSNTTIAKDQTGAGGNANEAHSITASANNGTALEQITASSDDHVWSCLMKRITGSGTVEVTVDGGSTWADVTSQINSSRFIQVSTGAGITVTNPEFGVRLGTSGDAVAVQISQLEQTSGQASSPIPTTGSTQTRAADVKAGQILAADMPDPSGGTSLIMYGLVSYADNDLTEEAKLYDWGDSLDYMLVTLRTVSTRTGEVLYAGRTSGDGAYSVIDAGGDYTPGINVAFKVAQRHSASEMNGVGTDGVAVGASTVPNSVPAIGSDDFDMFPVGNGFVGLLMAFEGDIGNAGIEEGVA